MDFKTPRKKTNRDFQADLFDLVTLILVLVSRTFSSVWLHEEHFQVSYEERKSHFKAVPNITETSTQLASRELIKYIRPPRKIRCYQKNINLYDLEKERYTVKILLNKQQ